MNVACKIPSHRFSEWKRMCMFTSNQVVSWVTPKEGPLSTTVQWQSKSSGWKQGILKKTESRFYTTNRISNTAASTNQCLASLSFPECLAWCQWKLRQYCKRMGLIKCHWKKQKWVKPFFLVRNTIQVSLNLRGRKILSRMWNTTIRWQTR